MSRYDKLIVMALTAVGAVAVVTGMIGTARKWWRDGIDAEFLVMLTLLYSVWVFVEHVWGKRK
ncbi:MAG: hypothetical protein EBR82_64700 [Caulobacteraceae bacterium]|nr:hypothetical protein [Caulobacteraceae bacterium]